MNVNFVLNVRELKEASKKLNKLSGKKHVREDEAVLEFQKTGVDITFCGMTMAVSGSGDGLGRARIKGWHIRFFDNLPLTEETIRLWVEDSTLRIGNSSIPCQWTDINPPLILLSMEPTFIEILTIGEKYDENQILASGLMTKWINAQEKKYELIAKAELLLSPLEITAKDIEGLFDSKISKHT